MVRRISLTNQKPCYNMVNQSELTILVRHKKMGEESLNRFKEEVRKFAVDHTFKVMLALYQLNYSNVVFLLVIRRQQRSLESITQRSQDGSRSQRRRTNVQTLETSTGRKVQEKFFKNILSTFEKNI